MYRIAIPVILLLLLPGVTGAQDFDLSQGLVKHENRQQPCVLVAFAPEKKEAKRAWKDHLEDRYDVNVKGLGFLANSDLLRVEESVINEISLKSIDLYARFNEQENQTQMCVFASMDNGEYVDPNEHPVEYRAMQTLVEGFLRNYVPTYYEDRIKETQQEVSKVERGIQKMRDQVQNNSKRIEQLLKEMDRRRTENENLAARIAEQERELQEVLLTLQNRKYNLTEAQRRLREIRYK